MPDVKIEIRSIGHMRVYGPVELVDQEGNPYTIPEGQWASLCRCGQSSNKPFCDGAHRDAGFDAPSKAN